MCYASEAHLSHPLALFENDNTHVFAACHASLFVCRPVQVEKYWFKGTKTAEAVYAYEDKE
jgi:hypothetical protein